MKKDFKVQLSEKISKLPPYLFAKIDQLKKNAIDAGKDVIDLGIGDPDLPTPKNIIKALQKAAEDPKNHRYPSYSGLNTFREVAAKWYEKRFGPSFDPEIEVLSLIGSKEGIANIPLAFVNPDDVVLVPDPGYPVYNSSTIFSQGKPHIMPLLRENGFLPDLDEIPEDIAKKSKLMFINYPNNPTSATCELDFLKKAVEFAFNYNVIICHDAAYSEISFDGYKAPSIFQVEGAREVGIEFHSLSKTYNMTGWRIGFALGNRELVGGLGKIKTNIDSGVFQAVQYAAMEALSGDQGIVKEMNSIYQSRRDIMYNGLRKAGFDVTKTKATFYMWIPCPKNYTSEKLTMHILENAAIVTTPGNGFGKSGEGYIRISLTTGEERLKEAVERLQKIKI